MPLTFKKKPTTEIAVIYSARLGDTLMVTPIVRSIKLAFPSARIHFWGHKRSKQVLKNNPDIYRYHITRKIFIKILSLVQIRKYKFVFLYNIDPILLKYSILRGKKIITYSENYGNYNNDEGRIHFIPRKNGGSHAVDHLYSLTDHEGIHRSGYKYVFEVGTKSRAIASTLIGADSTYFAIALAPFGSPNKQREPTIDFFSQLMTQLSRSIPDARFIIPVPKFQQSSARDLCSLVDANCLVLVSDDLELIMAITAASNMYIGIDTGPTHIASTLQIPMVALYYASHPATQFAPKEKSNLLTLTASSDMSLKSIAIEPIIEFVRQFET